MSRSSPRYKHTSRRGSSASNTFRSIEEIKQSLSELDNFLTITEDMILREQELDKELYRREREKKQKNDSPSDSSTSTPSPKLLHKLSRLRFENGKVVCIDEESPKSNITVTHKIVKEIIANETKLVNVEKLFDIAVDLDPLPETNQIVGICNSSKDSDDISLHSENSEEPKVSDEGEIIFIAHDGGDDGGKYRSFDENLLRSPTSGSAGSERQNFSSLPIVPAEIDEELVKKFIAAKNGVNLKKSSPM